MDCRSPRLAFRLPVVFLSTVPFSLPGLPPFAYDGTTELWFDTPEAIGKVFVFGDAEYLRLIRPDEAKFLDLPGCGFLVLTENPVA